MTAFRGSPRDAAWFDGLFHRHYSAVYAYCGRRAPGSAEDLTAEVFETAWRRRADIDGPELPWLYGVAHNHLRNHLRGATRRAQLTDRMRSEPATAADLADDVADHVTATDAVTALMAHLTDEDGEVLRLWAWEELNGPDIARVLGISPSAARARLSRARKRAAQLMREAAGRPDRSVRLAPTL